MAIDKTLVAAILALALTLIDLQGAAGDEEPCDAFMHGKDISTVSSQAPREWGSA